MIARINQIQEMLKSEPNDSFLNYALAIEYAKLNEIKKAIEIIEALLKHDENYLGAYYQLGHYYEQLEQPEAAISTYNKGIAIAKQQNNKKTLGELNEALWMLED
jgi:tetratricopeptide (TPR) repeat protein